VIEGACFLGAIQSVCRQTATNAYADSVRWTEMGQNHVIDIVDLFHFL
jgi:hypothetical protein